jgi:endonuclease G
MASVEAERRRQADAAAQRYAARREQRLHNIETVRQPGGLALADSPERVAKRLDRLSRYYAAERLPGAVADQPSAEPGAVIASALSRAARCSIAPRGTPTTAAAALEADVAADLGTVGTVLEKIILTPDFVGVRYLEAGVTAAAAVCRVDILDGSGRLVGYGTGSLVSPRLLLTNHHVLPDSQTAQVSAAEFNYQQGVDGTLRQSQSFGLDPATFYIADPERDFALVAVRATPAALSPFGFNRLVAAEGKAIIGEFVTIIQHPGGEPKQVALRENRIVDVADAFLHYEADTEPGSSGSPVFNDQWEVVALHHASVPAQNHAELGGYLNEGIRVSRIMQFLHDVDLATEQRALADQLATPERITLAIKTDSGPVDDHAPTPNAPRPVVAGNPVLQSAAAGAGPAVGITIPLEVTLRVGEPQSTATTSTRSPVAPRGAEAIDIDPDYTSRRGYEADFMGGGAASVPLPTLTGAMVEDAAVSQQPAAGQPSYVLTYHHFSVVLSKTRRLALFTAVNIDGVTSVRLKREADRWAMDPRLPAEQQTGEEVYRDNPLDRGHLVRRLDPAWGATRALAKLANDDTFHFTNCTPQHKDFNEHKTLWAGLEDYILEHADNLDMKVCVFSGPVLADDDEAYRGVKLPRQFWKVVVMVKESGALSATGYLLSQAQLIAGLEVAEAFSYGEYRTFQVPVGHVETLTGLDFGALRDHDPAAIHEATVAGREVARPEELLL